MSIQITALYASIMGLIFIGLTTYVGLLRGKTGISILHGDNMQLAERIRRQGNFTEMVPLALIMMGLAEMSGASALWLHLMGGILVIARLVHPFGIHADNPGAVLRVVGAAGSLLTILIAVIYILRPYTGW
ncbi:MAG: MAPEG family protein [Sneathiella sp.]